MRFKSELGRKIYSARKNLNLTQGDLAATIGVSRAAISQFELGNTVPSVTTINKLSKALDCELMLDWMDTPNPDQVVEGTTYLPFFPIASYHHVVTWVEQKSEDWLTKEGVTNVAANQMLVVEIPGYDYDDTFIIEVKGNSMMPRYPHGSRYIAKAMPATGNALRYSSGVHMILQRGHLPLFRRIVSTTNDRVIFRADATGEETELSMKHAEELMSEGSLAFYKLGQAVHLPPEE